MTEAYSRRPDASFLDTIDLSRENVEALLARCKTAEERADVVGLVEMALPLSSPARFAKKVDPSYLTPPHIQFLDRKIEDLVAGRLGKTKLLVTMPPRHGKQIRCDEPVLTTHGWTRADKLVPGDRVFGPDGLPTLVVAVSPVDFDAPKMRVSFTDGTSLDVHPDHEWTVYDRSCAAWRTVETGYLASMRVWSGERARFQLPLRQALVFPEADLPIPPYALGLWLGDGASTKSVVCVGEHDEDAMLTALAADGVVSRARNVHSATGVRYHSFAALSATLLKKVGVFGDKHVPESYLCASVEQRRDLLRGLVDSDGHVERGTGRVRVVGSSRRLIDGVRTLARSLGFHAQMWAEDDDREPHSLNGHPVKCRGRRYVASWTPFDGEPSGRLERKAGGRVGLQRRVGIVCVGQTESADGVCIQVDRADGLYLAGPHLIPTHNSELCSKYVPAWYLARYPDRRVILSSYEAEFAADWGRKARDVLEQSTAWTGIKIRSDSKAAHRWNIEGRKGGMQTAGVRGPITGKGAHLFIIDDPVKNSDDAMSETLRRKAWDWYISTAKTRLEPGAVQLLINTRWHQDDLAGKLLATEGDEWEVVNFPALAEEEDILGRKVGDALWPGAYDEAALRAIRDAPETGYWWSALYQQRPTPEDGGFFRRATFKHWSFDRSGKLYMLDGLPVPVKDTMRFQTVDLAASTKTRADFTVVSTWAVTKTEPANLLLLGRFRGRVEAPEHLSLIEGEHDRWSARKEEPQVRFTGVEKQTYGMQVLQEAARRGFHWLRPLEADRDKFSRAIPAAQLADAGRIWFPQDAAWLEEWESELLVFPNGAHDDQVDTLAYAALEIGRRRSWAPRVKEREPDSMQERIWDSIQKQRKRKGVHPVLGRW